MKPTPVLALLATALLLAGCSGDPKTPAPSEPSRPNVLFVVWDTTRADHTSVHGYERDTTPFLEAWAKDARVFDECVAVGSSTVPSHGGMFTGLLPSEYGASNAFPLLDGAHVTLAELFHDAGYRTYAFTANPHLGACPTIRHHGWCPEEVTGHE